MLRDWGLGYLAERSRHFQHPLDYSQAAQIVSGRLEIVTEGLR